MSLSTCLSALNHVFRSYSPKTGLMASSFGPKFSRRHDLDGPSSLHSYACMKGWYIGVFFYQGGQCRGLVLVTLVGCISALRKTSMILSAPNSVFLDQLQNTLSRPIVIQPQTQMRFSPRPKCDSRPISNATQHEPKCDSTPDPYFITIQPGPKWYLAQGPSAIWPWD